MAVRISVAIVRACYTMENGPNDKNGEKMGKTWKILPRSKMGKKWPRYFSAIFFPLIFDRGKFSTFFPFFPHFCRSARFPLCSRPARLQKPRGPFSRISGALPKVLARGSTVISAWTCTPDELPENGFGPSLKTLTSLNKESRPFFLGDNSMRSLPSVLPLAITACGGPESYFSLAIIAFGALEFIVPEYYCRLGKMEKRSLTSLI